MPVFYFYIIRLKLPEQQPRRIRLPTQEETFLDFRCAGITHDSVILMESQSCRIDIILYCPNMMSTGQFCGFMNPQCHRRVSLKLIWSSDQIFSRLVIWNTILLTSLFFASY